MKPQESFMVAGVMEVGVLELGVRARRQSVLQEATVRPSPPAALAFKPNHPRAQSFNDSFQPSLLLSLALLFHQWQPNPLHVRSWLHPQPTAVVLPPRAAAAAAAAVAAHVQAASLPAELLTLQTRSDV